MAKKIQVKGTAIVEGKSRNNVMYLAEELDKFAPTMVGRPILKDHENFTDNVIGKITNARSIDGGKSVEYEGWIVEDGSGIIDKVQDGRISEVSIGANAARLLKEKEDDDCIIAEGLGCLELSTTPVPGVVGTSMASRENYTAEQIKSIIHENLAIENTIKESHSNSHSQLSENYKEVINMESAENKNVSEAMMAESVELKAKLAESTKMIADLKEAQRQDAIAAYKAKASAKGVTEMDVSGFAIETVKALSAQLDNVKVAEASKPVAQAKTEEVAESAKTSNAFDNYVVERSELGGFAFYRK